MKKRFMLGDACRNCGATVDEINAIYSGVNLRAVCRSCHTERSKKYSKGTPEKLMDYNLRIRHKITLEEYNKKLELQLNGCAVCKQPCKTGRNLAVDHSHITGITRDLLCQRCNVILGLVGDDESLLFDLIEYLKRHESNERTA